MKSVLPHSIEWKEEELTVRILFLHFMPESDLYYAEVYISDKASMRYGHQLHVSRIAFKEITAEENPNRELLHHIVEPIIHIYHDKKENQDSSIAGSLLL